MKEEKANKKDSVQFNVVVPASWIERYKAIQERENCANYLEVFLGLITLYEQIAGLEDKKDETKPPE